MRFEAGGVYFQIAEQIEALVALEKCVQYKRHTGNFFQSNITFFEHRWQIIKGTKSALLYLKFLNITMVLSQNMISTLVAHFEKNGTCGAKMGKKCAFWVHILRHHIHHKKLRISIKNIFRTHVKSMFTLGAV